MYPSGGGDTAKDISQINKHKMTLPGYEIKKHCPHS